MAIHEQPRENLMRDATAYEKRILLRVTGVEEHVFWGQRKQGGWSIYFGEDPVYQFSESGELRRAFVNAVRYAARDGKLFKVTRDVRGGKVQLIWKFDIEIEKEISDKCSSMLNHLSSELSKDGVRVIDCIPLDALDKNLVALAHRLTQTEKAVRIAKQ